MNKAQIAVAGLASIPAFVIGGLTAPQNPAITDVVAEQATKEEYIQVLEDNKIPTGARNTLSTKLPPNTRIDVHSGPDGDGYSIVTKQADKTISIGIGAYAEENTWVKTYQASTTIIKK